MPCLTFTDADVRGLSPALAVATMADAVRLHEAGRLTAPPRLSADLGMGRAVLTAGATDDWYGYRVYDTMPTSDGEQVVVLHEHGSGRVAGVAVGSVLGQYRTGALGGVALRELSAREVGRVAVVGAGKQAWAQVWAMSAVLDVDEVVVAGRSPERERAFAARVERELGVSCRVGRSVEEAVAGAEVVILATTSSEPVLDDSWLPRDCVVVTVGPKQVGRAEFAPSLLAGAFVVTDSPQQLRAYDPPALAAEADAVALGAVVSGRVAPPTCGRRVYLSVGLAGTEVLLLAALLTEARHPR